MLPLWLCSHKWKASSREILKLPPSVIESESRDRLYFSESKEMSTSNDLGDEFLGFSNTSKAKSSTTGKGRRRPAQSRYFQGEDSSGEVESLKRNDKQMSVLMWKAERIESAFAALKEVAVHSEAIREMLPEIKNEFDLLQRIIHRNHREHRHHLYMRHVVMAKSQILRALKRSVIGVSLTQFSHVCKDVQHAGDDSKREPLSKTTFPWKQHALSMLVGCAQLELAILTALSTVHRASKMLRDSLSLSYHMTFCLSALAVLSKLHEQLRTRLLRSLIVIHTRLFEVLNVLPEHPSYALKHFPTLTKAVMNKLSPHSLGHVADLKAIVDHQFEQPANEDGETIGVYDICGLPDFGLFRVDKRSMSFGKTFGVDVASDSQTDRDRCTSSERSGCNIDTVPQRQLTAIVCSSSESEPELQSFSEDSDDSDDE